jgi:hypothetical protein
MEWLNGVGRVGGELLSRSNLRIKSELLGSTIRQNRNPIMRGFSSLFLFLLAASGKPEPLQGSSYDNLIASSVSANTLVLDNSRVGGRNFATTSNPRGFAWQGGTEQEGYRLKKWQPATGGNWVEVRPAPSVSASSYNDVMTPDQIDCYQLEALGPGGTVLAQTDLECVDTLNFKFPHENLPGFGIRSNQKVGDKNFALFWEPEPDTQYLVLSGSEGLTFQPAGTSSRDVTVNGLDFFLLGSVKNGQLEKVSNGLWAVSGIANFSNIPEAPTLEPTATPRATATRTGTPTPSPSPSPSPSRSPSPSPSRSPSPSPNLAPAAINYDIASNVPDVDKQAIQRSIDLSREEFRNRLGKDLLRPIGNLLNVKVVATGLGNPEPWGGGFCCTGTDPLGGSLFFDVRHPQWPNNEKGKMMVTGIELGGAYLESLDCFGLPIQEQLLPHWYNEAFGNYMVQQGMIRTGILNRQVAKYAEYVSAKITGQSNYSLSQLEDYPVPIFPGNIGYMAVDNLAQRSPNGIMGLRMACENMAVGSNREQAFQQAFGISKSDFYQSFPSYLQSLRSLPIYVEQVGRLPDGAIPWLTQGAIYEFNFVAYGFEDLTNDQQGTVLRYPVGVCGGGSKPGEIGKWVVSICSDPGIYPINIQMPDGRAARLDLVHTGPASSASVSSQSLVTPTPTRVTRK